MNRPKLIMIVLAVLMAITANNCGGGGGGGSGSDTGDNGGGTTSVILSPVGSDVESIMPYISTSNPTLGTSSLQVWNGWDPKESGTVLGKLLDPGIGGYECMYSRIQVFESHMEMANEFADKWDAPGTYTKGNVTGTIMNGSSTVTIPYFDFDLPDLDRHITMQVPEEALTINLAFIIDGNTQTIVEQYSVGNEEAGVFYSEKDGNTIRMLHAYLKTDLLTSIKGQMAWEGNAIEKWFKITECTNASGGNWEVMGGGDMSEMAFMARNDDNNSSEDEYYITITPQDLLAGNEQTITNAQTSPPSGVGALAYITEGDPRCFGFIDEGQYPSTLDELAWIQE
jgi:hypothetical protein